MSPPTTPVTIEVDAVTVRHRRGPESIVAVDAVSCVLAGPSMIAVVGPSGSGKTSFVNVLLGAQRPDAGRVEGVPSLRRWSEVALVPQQLGLLDELTIRENVHLPNRLTRAAGDDDLLELLELAPLADRLPREVSLGEQQRAAVARALVAGARLVVADEPTSHQDARRVDVVASALRRHADSGALVVVATHDERLVERCDRTLSMLDGRLDEADRSATS